MGNCAFCLDFPLSPLSLSRGFSNAPGKKFTDFAKTKRAVTWPTSARRHDLMIYSIPIRKLKRKISSRGGKFDVYISIIVTDVHKWNLLLENIVGSSC